MSSHINHSGAVSMIDITRKPQSARTAAAEGYILLSNSALLAIKNNQLKKGDALATARVAGILAAKNTPQTIPLCHQIPLSGCDIQLHLETDRVRAVCSVTCLAQTGAEMEALSGVGTALLTLYDMCKSIDKNMEIGGIRLLSKSGGASGDYRRPGAQ